MLAHTLPYAAFAYPVATVTPRAGSHVTVHAAPVVLRHFLDAAVDAMMRAAAATGEQHNTRTSTVAHATT
ncbi:MAG TPA: hypothetical protein VNU46_07425 [Gemmatimonadaceae bacterium]|jgi:hypothetical protein|nr:hypothetical protein [Gemmatimonadaceae bacterium]